MRIAVVSPYALNVPGGVQAQVIGLARHLRLQGHDAYAVAPSAGFQAHRVDVGGSVSLPINGARARVALSPRVLSRVREAVSDADVIHVHEPMVPLVGWGALGRDIPTVVTFHADPSRLFRIAYRWGSRRIRTMLGDAAATVVSPIAKGAIEHLGLEPVEIPNALDVGSFQVSRPRNPCQVAFVGRPDPRKGRDLLLSAWPRVRAVIPEARLLVIGGGETPAIEGVEYRGRVSEADKRSALAGSGVFCAPNRGGESFGITVAEGMAAGCAVVASDLAAFKNVLGGTGLLFRNGDPHSLERSLLEVLTDQGLRERLAIESTSRVAGFDWSNVIHRYLDIYLRVTQTGSG
ncbi:MAG: glycosyltransferase family 4 protein [bacterium]|nr:glycosyltransferase family 4 protein [bacterium]MDE0642633.1 glycosyltransferase family 4 protein [bacterium]MYD05116.1 glycosyltransferase family 4 protein [Acidimicrobiia bacterium]